MGLRFPGQCLYGFCAPSVCIGVLTSCCSRLLWDVIGQPGHWPDVLSPPSTAWDLNAVIVLPFIELENEIGYFSAIKAKCAYFPRFLVV